MHAIGGLFNDKTNKSHFSAIYQGAISEQFVGQELIAHTAPNIKSNLHYWVRESKNSSAEIDYLIEKNNKIIPIEVKSGTKGWMKSLLMFIEKHQTAEAFKILQAKYSDSNPIKNIPLYGIERFLKA